MSARIGIIGAGRRGAAHLAALATIDEVEITGVCDICKELAIERVAEHGGTAYTDHRDLLDDAPLDAVHVLTPPAEHYQPTMEALRRRLHVFLEKPVAVDEAQAEQMLAAADRAGTITSISYQLRYLSTVDRMLEELADRPIALLRGHYYWTIPPVSWAANRATGGGQVVEQATHIVDLCRLFAGEVTSVSAAYAEQTRTGLTEFDNWDACAVTFRFASGAVGSLATTYALFPGVPENAMLDVIAGRKGATPPIEPGDEVLLRMLVSGALRKYTRGGEGTIEPTEDPDLTSNRAFINAILTGDRSGIRSDIADAVRTLRVTLAANRSAATGDTVTPA